MAGYPYYSPPPPSPPCNDTTPTLPPPPPPPACNHTTTPTLPRPPPTACACNKTSPTLPPPASPPPHSSYYSPPLASMSSPPPPPSTRYSPPSHSPPPSSHPPPASPPPPPLYYSPPLLPPPSSDYSPPPPSQSPPKPSNLSPPPLLQPTKPPPAPSPYYSPQTPLHPPLAPNPPLCHCVCPSPWATPPSYYPSIAPSPQFLSPSNGPRTVVLTTFVSLGGVFFLAFITIGLLSMAIRKRMPSMPTMGQPDNSHGQAQSVQSIPESTSAAHSVIDIGPNKITVPPDQGVSHIVKEGEIPQQTMSTAPLSNQSVPNKISADPDVDFEEVKDDPNKRLSKEQELGDDQESIGDDQEKLNDSNKKLGKPLADQNVPDNMDTPPDAEQEPDDDEEKSDERNRKPPDDQGETGNTTQDVNQESNAAEDESNYSKKKIPKRSSKKNRSDGHKGQKGEKKSFKLGQTMKDAIKLYADGEQESEGGDNGEEEEVHDSPQDEKHESNADEKKSDERDHKPFGDPSVTNNADIDQESSAVEAKSNDSRNKLHPHMKNPFSGRKGKKGGKNFFKVGQAMKAAIGQYGESESQDDDNDEGQVLQDQDALQDVDHESIANEEESDERNRMPLIEQTETDNLDAAQDVEQVSYAVEEESNDSKAQLRTRKKTYNARKGEQGDKQFPKLGQAGKAAINFYPDAGEQEYQDDESDEAEAQEVSQVAEDQSNAYEGTSDERNRKPFGDQSVTDVTDIAQDVDQESSAVEIESTNSNERLRRPHKKGSSSGLKGKQGERKSSKLGQFVKAAVNVDLDGAVHPQDYDNDEAEEEQSYRGRKELSNLGQILTVTSDDNSGKDLESFGNPDDKEEESEAYSSNQDLRRHKRHTSTQGRKVSSNLSKKFSATIGADPGVSLADDDEKAKKPELYGSDEDLPRNIFIGAKNLNQIVTETFGHDPSMECKSLISDGDKEESESFGSNKDSRLHTRQISVRRRKEPLNEGQILTASISGDPGMYLKFHADDDENEENDDLVNECDDPSMEGESFVNDNAKKAESKSFGSKKVSHLQKSQTGAQRRKEAPDVGQTSTTPIGGDVGVDLKSLADDYDEKEENEDPSIECDDPNMEYYELLVDDDAKEEKSDSFGSKKVSRLHKRQIGAPGRRDPRNVGHIWSDPLGGDPSTYFKSFADDDEKEEKEDQGMECDDPSMELEPFVDDGAKEESEPFGLKKVRSLQNRQIGGRGRKGSPNVGQFLNIPTGGDAGVDLKFLAVEQKKLELFGRKEVSRLHKRQTGASGRKEPPNVAQILTATTGSDPRVGLKSVGTQVWVSNIGESMTVRNDDYPYGELESHDDDGEGDLSVTATNEGDPNAGLEFHEEDEELESECSNKGLALQKLHSLSLGETEPSTDDQSVFVTGDDDPDESGKVARSGNPLSRPRTTGVRGKIT